MKLKQRILAALMAAAMIATSVPESAMTVLASEPIPMEMTEEVHEEESIIPEAQAELGTDELLSDPAESVNQTAEITGESPTQSDTSPVQGTDDGGLLQEEAEAGAGDGLLIEDPEAEIVPEFPDTGVPTEEETIPDTEEETLPQETETAEEILPDGDSVETEMSEDTGAFSDGSDMILDDTEEMLTEEETEAVSEAELLMEEATESSAELASEEKTITGLTISGGEGVLRYSPLQASKDVRSLPVIVTYSDGTMKSVNNWGTASIDGINRLSLDDTEGRNIMLTMKSGETEVGVPGFYFEAGAEIPFGNYTLYASYEYYGTDESGQSQRYIVEDTLPIEISLPETVIDAAAETEYSTMVGGAAESWFRITPQESGEYTFKETSTQNVYSELYRKEDGSLICCGTAEEIYGWNRSYMLEAGKEYYFVQFDDLEGDAPTVTFRYGKRKVITDITIDASNLTGISPFKLQNALNHSLVTISYSDGTQGGVSTEGREWITEEGQEYWTPCFDDEWNNEIVLKLSDVNGNVLLFRDEKVLALEGTYTLTAYVKNRNPEIETSENITIISPDKETMDVDMVSSFALTEGAEKLFLFTPTESGEYTFKTNFDYGYGNGVLYRIDSIQNVYSYVGGRTGSSAIKETLQSGETYALLVTDFNMWDISQGTVSLEKGKQITGLSVTAGDQLSVSELSIEKAMTQLEVNVAYGEGEAAVTSVIRNWNGGWNSSSQKNIYTSVSAEGDQLCMELFAVNADGTETEMNVPSWNEHLTPGIYKLRVYVEESAIEATIMVTVTPMTEAEELKTGVENFYSVSAGSDIVYSFTPETTGVYKTVLYGASSDFACSAWKKIRQEDNQADTISEVYGLWEGTAFSAELSANERYYLIIYPGKSVDGSFTVQKKKEIASIDLGMEEGERSAFDLFSWNGLVEGVTSTVTYDNGDRETIFDWWSSTWYETTAYYRTTENGDSIYLKLMKDSGEAADSVQVPVPDYYSVPVGNFRLVAVVPEDSGERELTSVPVTITGISDNDTIPVNLGETGMTDISEGETACFRFQLPETANEGEYLIRQEMDSGCYDYLYGLDENGVMHKLDETYGSGALSAAMQRGWTYYLYVADVYDYTNISVSFLEKKALTAASVKTAGSYKPMASISALKKLPVTLTYGAETDEASVSTEVISSWHQSINYDYDEEGESWEYSYYYNDSQNGDQIRLYLLNESGRRVSFPDTSRIPTGTYHVEVYCGDTELGNSSSFTILSGAELASGALALGTPGNFSVTDSAYQYYTYTAEEQDTYLVTQQFDTGKATGKLYLCMDSAMVQLGSSSVSGERYAAELSEGETICFAVKGKTTVAEGSVLVEKQKRIQSIAFAEDTANRTISVWNASEEIPQIPLTVIYEDGTEETLSEWPYSDWIYVTDEATGEEREYTIRYLETSYQQRIYLKLTANGEWQSIPEWGVANGPLGNVKLTAYEDRGDGAIAETDIVLQLDADKTTEVPLESSVNFDLHYGEAERCFLFQPPEGAAGMEFVIQTILTEGDVELNLYRVTENRIEEVSGTYENIYIPRNKATTVFTVEANEKYLMRMVKYYGEEAGPASGTVAFRTRQYATDFAIGGVSEINALDLVDYLRTLPVTVSYGTGENAETETVQKWFNYGECMEAKTEQGQGLYLYLEQEGEAVSPPAFDGANDVPLGAYTLTLREEEESEVLASKEIMIHSPDSEMAPGFDTYTELTPDSSCEISLNAGEQKIYCFAPEDAQAGNYEIGIRTNSYLHMDWYYLDESGLTYQDEWGSWDETFWQNCAAGRTSYLVVRAEDTSAVGMLSLKRLYGLTSVELADDLVQKEVIEGLKLQGVYIGYQADIRGMSLKMTYADGHSEILPVTDWEWLSDSYGNSGQPMVYPVGEDGNPDYTMPYYGHKTLAPGKYVVAIEGLLGEEPVAPAEVTVISKAEAAARHPFPQDGDSVTFTDLNGYFVCTSFTPETEGRYSFATDALAERIRIFEVVDGTETMVKAVTNGKYGFDVETKAGASYIIAIQPAQECDSLTLTKKTSAQDQIDQARLSMTDPKAAAMIQGIDYFDLADWLVELSYKDGTENVTLGALETDEYGNAFRYEVQEKDSGEVVSKDAYGNFLDIGDYLVTAVHRTLSAIRSNTVEIVSEPADTSVKIKTNQAFTLADQEEHQIFAVVPEISDYYTLETETGVDYGFYTQEETGLERCGSYLNAGTEYVLCVDHSPKQQTAVLSGGNRTEVSFGDYGVTLPAGSQNPDGGVKEYLYVPEEDGRYSISLEGTDLTDKRSLISLWMRDEEGSEWHGFEQCSISAEMLAGRKYYITVSSYLEEELSASLRIQKAVLPVEIVASLKEGADPGYYYFSQAFLYPPEILDIICKYADGTEQKLTRSMKDSYGNEMYFNSWGSSGVLYYVVYAEGAPDVRSNTVKVVCSRDTSDFKELTLDTPVTGGESGKRREYYLFNPQSAGDYTILVNGNCMPDGYDVYTSFYENEVQTNSGIMYLWRDRTYVICVETYDTYDSNGEETDNAGKPYQIEVKKKHGIKSLTLKTPAVPIIKNLEQTGKGMTAEAVYADGTTKLIHAEAYMDSYGNRITVETRNLPGGMTRIILSCGSRYVTCDVKNKTTAELPQLKTAEMTDFVVGAGERVLAGFVPEADGMYQLVCVAEHPKTLTYMETICKGDGTEEYPLFYPRYLKAGQQYIVTALFGNPDNETQTVSLKMERTDVTSCEHTWNEGIVTKGPACAEDGIRTFTCTRCGETRTEVIPALGHKVVTESSVAPTCTTAGRTEHSYCSVCDAVFVKGEEIPALGHITVTDAAVEATCTESGLTEGSHCSRCNVVLVEQQVIEAKGHTEVTDAAVEATCTTGGLTAGKHCSECGEVLIAQEEVPATGHTVVTDAAVEATCTTPGKTAGSHCSVCDTVFVAQKEIPALGHKAVIDEAVEATCTTPGKTAGSHCSVCDEVLTAQEPTEALGHTAVEDAAVEATCTTGGLTAGSHCSVCGEVLIAQEPTEALGHTVVEDAAVPATCIATGLTAGSHCDRCKEVFVKQEATPKTGHTWDSGIVQDDGSTLYTCTVTGCKATMSKDACADGHKEDPIPAVEATCKSTGLTEGIRCSVCGKILTPQKETPALGHVAEIIPAVKATCAAIGWTEGSRCKNCGEILIAPEVIPKTAEHIWGIDTEAAEAKAATCKDPGTRVYKCSVCRETRTETIPALGHDMELDETTAEAATCTTDGKTAGSRCTREGCPYQEDGELIPATGHVEVKDAAVAATCTTNGKTEGSHCSVCGKVLVEPEVIEARHTIVTDAAVAATCTTDGKTEGRHCSVCGETIEEQKVIEAAGHQEESIPAVEATCTLPGKTEGCICSVCGAILTEQTEIPMLGHDWDEGVTEAGVTIYTCQREGCGQQTVTGPCKDGHTIVTDEAVAATCTKNGLTEGSHCSVCGTVIKAQEVISKTDHVPVIDEAEEPTCRRTGLTEGSHCASCNMILKGQQEIPKKEHKWQSETDNYTAPTCENTGVQLERCADCGLRRAVEIPAAGHEWGDAPTIDVDATCTAVGRMSIHCKNCDAVTQVQEIPMTAHLRETVEIPSTCDKAGVRVTRCKRCYEVFGTEVLPTLAHSYSPWAVTKEASCTEDGQQARICMECGASETKTLPKLGHKMSDTVTVKSATCTENGLWYKICGRSGCTYAYAEQIPATGHRYGEAQTTYYVDAEGNTDGSGKVFEVCTICSDEHVIREIPKDKEQEAVSDAQTLVEDETADAKDALEAVRKIDNQTLLNASENGSGEIDVVKKLDDKLTASGTAAPNFVMKDENGEPIATDETSVTGAAITAASVIKDSEAEPVFWQSEEVAMKKLASAPDSEAGLLFMEAVERINNLAAGTETGGISLYEETESNAESGELLLENGAKRFDEGGKAYYPLTISMTVKVNGTDTKVEKFTAPVNFRNLQIPKELQGGDMTFKLYRETSNAETTSLIPVAYEMNAAKTAITFNAVDVGVYRFGDLNCRNHTEKEGAERDIIREPDCQQMGIAETVCGNCGNKMRITLDQTGHQWETVAEGSKDPTCTEDGVEVQKCLKCGEVKERTIPHANHVLTTETTKATCTEEGQTVVRCENCDYEKITVFPRQGHQWGEWTTLAEAGCEPGEETRTCTVCDATESRSIPAVNEHHWGKVEVTQQPTCMAKGQRKQICILCETERTVDIPMDETKHDFTKEIIDRKATCTESGEMHYVCQYCDAEEPGYGEPGFEETEIPATGHTVVTDASVAATCTATGLTEGSHCSVCDEVLKAQKEIPATGHTKVTDASVAATCTETGLTEGSHCSVCGAVITAQTKTNALGHAWNGGLVTTAPTCTKPGVKTFTCTRCNEKKTETIPTNGQHSAGAWETVKQPTCTVAGEKVQKCTACQAIVNRAAIPATGAHTFGAWSVSKTATALAEGQELRRCSVCGQTETRATAKLKSFINLNATSVTLKLKQSTTGFKVTGMQDGDSVKSWKSSNTKIFKVTNGKAGGTCKLTAQSKVGKADLTITLASGLTKKIKITVQKGNVKTTKVTVSNVSKSKLTLAKGKKFKLTPVVAPFTSLDKVTYKTSNKKIVTVSAKGELQAKAAGKATITVKAGSKSTKITVTVPKTLTKKITGVPTSKSIKKGKKYTLKAKLSPANSDEKITYSTSNKSIATVSTKGVITAKKKGTVTITVKSGKISVKCKVTVN